MTAKRGRVGLQGEAPDRVSISKQFALNTHTREQPEMNAAGYICAITE